MAPHLSDIYDRFGERPDWMSQARCQGVPGEIFFPHSEEDASVAKTVCAECPVRDECLDYALTKMRDATDSGVWGGTTEKERRAMRRKARRNHPTARSVTPVTK